MLLVLAIMIACKEGCAYRENVKNRSLVGMGSVKTTCKRIVLPALPIAVNVKSFATFAAPMLIVGTVREIIVVLKIFLNHSIIMEKGFVEKNVLLVRDVLPVIFVGIFKALISVILVINLSTSLAFRFVQMG
jgi:hypothetical protein